MAIDVSKQGICGICGCMDHGLAVLRSGRLLWVCDDPQCLDIAQRFSMRQDDFNKLEAEAAIEDGGTAFGQFLDEAGYGALFDGMPPEVFAEAMKRGVAGYRRGLKKRVDDGTIPF